MTEKPIAVKVFPSLTYVADSLEVSYTTTFAYQFPALMAVDRLIEFVSGLPMTVTAMFPVLASVPEIHVIESSASAASFQTNFSLLTSVSRIYYTNIPSFSRATFPGTVKALETLAPSAVSVGARSVALTHAVSRVCA